MEGSFEEKVLGTLMFIRKTSERELAELIVRQSAAIDGLSKNNSTFIKTFHEIYKKTDNTPLEPTNTTEPLPK